MTKPIEEFDTVEDAVPIWQRHEWTSEEAMFVQAYLRTGEAGKAWFEAFQAEARYVPGGTINIGMARLKGNELLRQAHIKDYVACMRGEIKARLVLNKDTVLEELNKLAMSNLADFLVIGRDGEPQYDLSSLSREQFAAIQELSIETFMDGPRDSAREVKRVRLKLAPKINALEALGKHFKLFTDVVEMTDVTDAADIMSRRKREQRARRMAEQGQSGDEEPQDSDAAPSDDVEHIGEYDGDEIA